MKKYGYLYMAAALMLPQVLPSFTYGEEVAPTVQLSFDERMDETMKAFAPMLGIQSLQYAIIDDGELIASGDTAHTTDTLYGIGSVSKMYTTMAVMQLVEENKIDLDTPVVQYIADFVMADERYKDITPRMLLNHSSGLMGSTFKNTWLIEDQDDLGTRNFLKALESQRLKADPGAYSVYCNDGFTLAEILVEYVSGMSFTEYIHTYITGPLSLENTVTPREDWKDRNIAAVYDAAQNIQPTEVFNHIGTGGIYATAEDLARVGEVYLGKYEDILTQEMIDLTKVPEYQRGMWIEEDADSALAFGLGWDHINAYPFSEYEIPALLKGGDINGYHASLIVLPEEDMVAAIVSTGGMSTYNHLLGSHVLINRLQDEGIIKEVVPTKTFEVPQQPVLASEEEIKNAGKYGSMLGLTLDITILPEGTLNISFVGLPEAGIQSFIHTGDGKYVSADGTSRVSFAEESNGEVYFKVDTYVDIPGIAGTSASDYQAQKLQENKLTQEVEDAWALRNGKTYYIIDEKYSSMHHQAKQGVVINLQEALPGYVLGMKIDGEHTAKGWIQIPGSYGRDIADMSFFMKDGIEYMNYNGYLGISEDAIATFDIVKNQTVTIGADGYAKWFNLATEDAGKRLQVKMPENASFAVYDAAGIAVNFSRMTGVNEAVLPEGGSIVFMGDAGIDFEIIEVIK